MITKFRRITDFTVFKNFDWDKEICGADGSPLPFKKLNIIFGRNYSGKTTLSRIIRSLENGRIAPEFGTPKFSVEFSDGSFATQGNLLSHGYTIRVFNEDFVRENLRFITDPSGDIEPFAILGSDNNLLETEIRTLESELGSDEAEKETGLYAKLKQAQIDNTTAQESFSKSQKDLDELLVSKATKSPRSIRNRPEQFGDQNYNIGKLRAELERVNKPDFKPLDSEKREALIGLLAETPREDVPEHSCPQANYDDLYDQVVGIVARKLSRSHKIKEFLADARINKWASEGHKLHLADHTTCHFCDNTISSARWAALESHFDEASNDLERDIEKAEHAIDATFDLLSKRKAFNTALFYKELHASVAECEVAASQAVESCCIALQQLKDAVSARKQNILQDNDPPLKSAAFADLQECYLDFDGLRQTANAITTGLKERQTEAKIDLRLDEVHRFSQEISFDRQTVTLEELKKNAEQADNRQIIVTGQVSAKLRLIEEKRRQLHDEAKGAERVNELLHDFFGNRSFKLEALPRNQETGDKTIRFQVMRGTQIAHYLSEGERSLLAFCYFLARLEADAGSSAKPIVWIDDPISSLDGNHIFFVFSLISAKLCNREVCAQLFVSTHNLEFLKYLKRLPGTDKHKNVSEGKRKCRHFVVERCDTQATLALMPNHMQEFVTEFNYLFHQIYKCSQITTVDDSNYTEFYSFGNNARKFLEIFLYYSYPDDRCFEEKMTGFFGGADVPTILVDRINNEYSHLSGVFERGQSIVSQPEMHSCAKLIIERLQRNPEQYAALLRSVGESSTAESFLASLQNAPMPKVATA